MVMQAHGIPNTVTLPIAFIGLTGVLFVAFFYGTAYAPFVLPIPLATWVGPLGYFAVLAFCPALTTALLLKIPFGMLFPERTGIWALACSMTAALVYMALAVDALGTEMITGWPLMNAAILVTVFTSLAGFKAGRKHEDAT
jgi:hypothetical protein